MPAWQVASAGGFLRREIVARQGCSDLRAMGRLVPEMRGGWRRGGWRCRFAALRWSVSCAGDAAAGDAELQLCGGVSDA